MMVHEDTKRQNLQDTSCTLDVSQHSMEQLQLIPRLIAHKASSTKLIVQMQLIVLEVKTALLHYDIMVETNA